MKKFFPIYVRIPLVFALVLMALEFFIDSGNKPAFLKYPVVSLFLFVVLFLHIAMEVVVDAINKVTYTLLTEEEKQKLAEAEALDFREMPWFIKLKGFFVKTRPVEDEGSILLHHDYDGIRELDNVLPPWWVKMFYATIIFSVIYLARYHVFEGEDQKAEFDTEMEEARLAVEEYKKTAKDLIDSETVTLLTGAGDIAEGKKLFDTNCMACHRADGGGAIGPNLTDEHWVLGGGIKNVFNTIIKGGRDGKGMVAWKGTLKPSEIQKVASYVLSLQGTNPPDAKAPEGDVWKEEKGKEIASTINNK